MNKSITLIAFILQFTFCAFVAAQNALTIEGPNQVSKCDLVRLVVSLDEGESAIWIVEPNDLDHEVIDVSEDGKSKGSKVVFTLGCHTQATIRVIAGRIVNEKIVWRQVLHVVTATDSEPITPKPDPVKPGPDKPPRDWSPAIDWAEETRPSKENAVGMAEALQKAAKECEAETIKHCVRIIEKAIKDYLQSLDEQSENWNPFVTGLAEQMGLGFGTGPSPKDWKEVVACLDAVQKDCENEIAIAQFDLCFITCTIVIGK